MNSLSPLSYVEGQNMKTQYIAGRPLTINGEALEVGDTLTKAQVESIPRLESWINGRFIFTVISDKQIDSLPNHLAYAYRSKQAEKSQAMREGEPTMGELPAAVKAKENHLASRQVEKAEREAKVQTVIYQMHQGVTAEPEDKVIGETIDEQAQEAQEVVSDDVFDPAEHSVAEVKDYLDQHPEETDIVLAAEAKGKARKTLVGDTAEEE